MVRIEFELPCIEADEIAKELHSHLIEFKHKKYYANKISHKLLAFSNIKEIKNSSQRSISKAPGTYLEILHSSD